MVETLDMERTTKPASDRDIEVAAGDILHLLKDFESPKDAGSAFTLAHWEMLKASFPPANKAEAIAALEAHTELLKQFINEGWQ